MATKDCRLGGTPSLPLHIRRAAAVAAAITAVCCPRRTRLSLLLRSSSSRQQAAPLHNCGCQRWQVGPCGCGCGAQRRCGTACDGAAALLRQQGGQRCRRKVLTDGVHEPAGRDGQRSQALPHAPHRRGAAAVCSAVGQLVWRGRQLGGPSRGRRQRQVSQKRGGRCQCRLHTTRCTQCGGGGSAPPGPGAGSVVQVFAADDALHRAALVHDAQVAQGQRQEQVVHPVGRHLAAHCAPQGGGRRQQGGGQAGHMPTHTVLACLQNTHPHPRATHPSSAPDS